MNYTALMIRRGNSTTLVAADGEAAQVVRKIPPEGQVMVHIIAERDAKQNRHYWLVLKRVVESTGMTRTPQQLHAALKLALGYIDTFEALDGHIVPVPSSIAFGAMDQEEADEYYRQALAFISDEIIHMPIRELLDEGVAC